jgi:hypothetical protein
MKYVEKKVRIKAVLETLGLLFVAGILLAGCATLDQNMAASLKEYVVPGKVMHVADMNNYPFCEIGLITGTSPSNAVLNIWNSTSVSDCPPDKFDPILANEGAQIKQATGALKVWLNPRRHWTFNEITAYEAGNERDFEGVKMLWLGVVGAETAQKAVGGGHYKAHIAGEAGIVAHRAFKFNKGSTVYLLDVPDGKVFVMQSWTNHFNKSETAENLKDLGSQFKQLPPGWKFRVKVLDQNLIIAAKNPPYHSYVTQDEFWNTYSACGYDDTCNYVP